MEVDPEISQMFHLIDHSIKTNNYIIYVLKLEKWIIQAMFRDTEEKTRKQTNLLEMKSIMYEIKSILDWINGKLDIVEEKISEFEDLATKNFQK